MNALAVVRRTSFVFGALCCALLCLSIYPGVLNQIAFVSILFGAVLAPVACLVLSVIFYRLHRSKRLKGFVFMWQQLATNLVILLATIALLKFYVPRKIVFKCFRKSFLSAVIDFQDIRQLDGHIGPYKVDACMQDKRGGTYFRVFSCSDGIGPDTMSYGFCYLPNRAGTPFGAASYRVFSLDDGWYWFKASDDHF